MSRGSSISPLSLSRIKKMLGGIFLLTLLGTGAELLLLGHTEGFWQMLPLLLLGLALVLMGLNWLMPGRVALKSFRALMILLVLAGFWGTWMHYSGNVEFELEMYPTRGGWELFKESMTGATPVLAPGAILGLGLTGWLYSLLPSLPPDLSSN